MTESPSTDRKSVLDSPWYWVYLFSAAALAALFLAGPRYAARQAQLERNYQARQRAVQQRVGETPSTPLSDTGRTSIPLWPLFAVLSLLLMMAWWQLWRKKLPRVATDEPPPPTPQSPHSSGGPSRVDL
jgi:hypothetical protein